MRQQTRVRHSGLLMLGCSIVLLLSIVGCTSAAISNQPTISVPTLMPTMPLPAQSPQISDTGWVASGPGVFLRQMQVIQGERLAPVTIVRLIRDMVTFRVGYAPDQPPALATWHKESGGLATINGGFFDENNQSTALVISDGIAYGSSYVDSGGMFAIDMDGRVSLRYLAEQPYMPDEPLAQALQGWPMLIAPGGILTYTSSDEQPARRSVVAIDNNGDILFIACPGSDFTLRHLADWLLASDLDIYAALNLDGGSSTGLYLDGGDQRVRIDAFVPLPITLHALLH